MRSDEQRFALDRFAGNAARLARYQKLRDAWQLARRDFLDRKNRARELALEADSLKLAIEEIDRVDPSPGEDDALVADIRRLSELDALRDAAAEARAALAGALDDVSAMGEPVSVTDALGRAVTLLECPGAE
jgi:DNA repair protein RecN (Recombination protein N)